MKEEMEQLNKRFDKLEEMIIKVTEMVLATNQRLEIYVQDSTPEQRI